MPYSEYLIFDPSSKTQIQLADMLVPAKQARNKHVRNHVRKPVLKRWRMMLIKPGLKRSMRMLTATRKTGLLRSVITSP